MSEQLTLYHDNRRFSPFCHRVEIALLEVGASYTVSEIDLQNKPAWFSQVNPWTGKIPAITYGGPIVPPEEPSPLSFKLTESCVILEFLADLYPNSGLLPPVSNPTARAHVRRLIGVVTGTVEAALFEFSRGVPGALEKVVAGLEKVQSLLPDPDAADGGEYAIGKDFTNADCVMVTILWIIKLATRTDLGGFEPGAGKQLGEILGGEKFERLRRYKKAVWERESVKKVVDLDYLEGIWRARFASK